MLFFINEKKVGVVGSMSQLSRAALQDGPRDTDASANLCALPFPRGLFGSQDPGVLFSSFLTVRSDSSSKFTFVLYYKYMYFFL